MIDLHTHSLFSDGELIPSELVRRAVVKGYRAIAITDHADLSNIDMILPRIAKVALELSRSWGIDVLPGVELTHVPPASIAGLAKEARALGALIVLCHGETIVEPVPPGTNSAALNSDIDILTHPGLITAEDAALAAKRGICLEITARKGHSLTNGHVARVASEAGAKLLINTDAHSPGDLITREAAERIVIGAGLNKADFQKIMRNAEELVNRLKHQK
ncbi:MAG TPA: histidinol phosphate phosphatase domain-containing protein [Thermodesulfobacteriota bacterium]|nr:histidinol phosphate phosphatase domain-containing protein [Thermodesulfobacteriota bacterium]